VALSVTMSNGAQVLPGDLPFGARTFLDGKQFHRDYLIIPLSPYKDTSSKYTNNLYLRHLTDDPLTALLIVLMSCVRFYQVTFTLSIYASIDVYILTIANSSRDSPYSLRTFSS
jgi:hypothetical protein